jgi:hypothetical protein
LDGCQAAASGPVPNVIKTSFKKLTNAISHTPLGVYVGGLNQTGFDTNQKKAIGCPGYDFLIFTYPWHPIFIFKLYRAVF